MKIVRVNDFKLKFSVSVILCAGNVSGLGESVVLKISPSILGSKLVSYERHVSRGHTEYLIQEGVCY